MAILSRSIEAWPQSAIEKVVLNLEVLHYTYRGGAWLAPAGAAATPLPLTAEAVAMRTAL
jgi:hypothetical protein